MKQSEKYEEIAGYYRFGFWSKQQVKKACMRGRITPAEYKDITGEEYNSR